jgi:2-oxoglutarate dehydrogenase E2 component (dihydrolipoamide succinyltransferase)
VLKRLVNEGDVVKVGQPIAQIGSAVGAAAPAPVTTAATGVGAQTLIPSGNGRSAPASVGPSGPVERNGPSGKFYSPLVRNIAQSEGVSLQELEAIAGSGQGGRVTKKDILDYLPNRAPGATARPGHCRCNRTDSLGCDHRRYGPCSHPAGRSHGGPLAGDELIEMDRMRKLIADHMVMSKRTSPHVTSFVEADVTNLWLWREKVKKAFEQREGEKLTFTPVFIMAIVQAIKEMPMVNVQVDGYTIIKKRDINIGMAAAMPNGNLIVPVIKNADQLNLVGMAKKVNDLANRARLGKLCLTRSAVAPTP